MSDIQPVDYPRYAYLADLAWFNHIRYFGTWQLVTKHEDGVKKTFQRLMALPEHREVHVHENTIRWRQEIAEGKLTAEQLWRQLYDERDGGRYEPSSDWQKRVEQRGRDSAKMGKASKIVDLVLHGKDYPSTIFGAFDFGSLHLVATPTGVTDELCYEFVSAHRTNGWQRRLEAARILAHADAYLLNRPNIVVHLHVRSNDKEEIISEPTDTELGGRFLEAAESTLQDIAKFHIESEARRKAHG